MGWGASLPYQHGIAVALVPDRGVLGKANLLSIDT